jgi:hypothetical protein
MGLHPRVCPGTRQSRRLLGIGTCTLICDRGVSAHSPPWAESHDAVACGSAVSLGIHEIRHQAMVEAHILDFRHTQLAESCDLQFVFKNGVRLHR